MSRRIAALLLAVVAATGLLATPAGTTDVRAAAPGLTIVTAARYDVQPANHRVHVTVDMTLTNRLKDTRTQRYYFDRAFLSVQPGASAFTLDASGSASPKVKVASRTATYTLLQFTLAARLYSGKTVNYQLAFDLADKGGAASRDVRVGPSLASFPVWAFATDSTPGSSVRVTFPAGFTVEAQAGSIPKPTTQADGTTVFDTGRLDKPLSFFAYLVGDRPADLVKRSLDVDVAGTRVPLTIESWPDDSAWSQRVGGLTGKALPALAERIGLPWPRDGGLTVREAVTRSTGGYAGLFDPAGGEVEVAFDASDAVVLHEAAHAWFNGALLGDRWTNEAFASYYGLAVAPTLGIKATGPALTKALEASRIPLNAWGPVGEGDPKAETYAYAASLALAKAIAERATDATLRAVWADAAGHVGAYQPTTSVAPATTGSAIAPETVTGAPDWRGLLDLLEAHSGKSFADLWRTWVARDTDLPLLDARAAARTRYDQVVTEAGAWLLPREIRDAMRAWQFDQATGMLTDAEGILRQRSEIESKAAASGLTAPPTLRTAFEGTGGLAAAGNEASTELRAIAAYDAAVAAEPSGGPGLLQALGSFGTDPAGDLAKAKALFATGDLAGSTAAAANAASAWASAENLGRGRIVSLILLVLALVFAGILVASWYRGRRRRRRVTMTPGDLGV